MLCWHFISRSPWHLLHSAITRIPSFSPESKNLDILQAQQFSQYCPHSILYTRVHLSIQPLLMYNNPWTSYANNVLKWEFLFFLTCQARKTQKPSMGKWVWIKILIQTTSIYRNFLKHGYSFAMAHNTQEFLSKQDIDGTSLFLLLPSKPSKEKFQIIHLRFTLLFHANKILVFYMKILLSNINKPNTVKLCCTDCVQICSSLAFTIWHFPAWSCITGHHTRSSFRWEILWK